MEIDVRRAVAADAETVAAAYAAASADEAVNAWVMAGGGLPPEVYGEHLREFVAAAITEDEVWTAGAGGEVWGVAVWIAVESTDRFAAEAERLAATAVEHGLPALERAARVARVTARAHPRESPHLYLHSIGTVPEHRGRGAGAALLVERVRSATVPVYLEASTERSARLYERLGFVPEGEPIALPEGGPVLVPMWRRRAAPR